MEFEQNGRTYGKTIEFSFWWKKCVLSLKNGGKIRPDFEMWFQCLLLRLSCLDYHFTRPSSANLPGYRARLLLDQVNC